MDNAYAGNQQNANASAPAPPTELGSLHARLNEACGILADLNDRQRRTADAVHGSRPEKDGETAHAGILPNGALAQITETVDRLFRLLDDNSQQSSRLNNLA